MAVEDLFTRELSSYAPLKVEGLPLNEITPDRLKQWAIEICKDVFPERTDSTCDKE